MFGRGENLGRLDSQLQRADASERQTAEEGRTTISKAMKYIEEGITPPEATKEKNTFIRKLLKAQMLLESCVETVLINKLGSFKFPVAKRLGELWTFPSDHPPIAAVLTLGNHSIKVASWNVLNRNYYKYEKGRENRIVEKIEEMLGKGFELLCLQECWPEFLKHLGETLKERQPEFLMRCSGEEADKNQEANLSFETLSSFFQNAAHNAPCRMVSQLASVIKLELNVLSTPWCAGDPFLLQVQPACLYFSFRFQREFQEGPGPLE